MKKLIKKLTRYSWIVTVKGFKLVKDNFAVHTSLFLLNIANVIAGINLDNYFLIQASIMAFLFQGFFIWEKIEADNAKIKATVKLNYSKMNEVELSERLKRSRQEVMDLNKNLKEYQERDKIYAERLHEVTMTVARLNGDALQ